MGIWRHNYSVRMACPTAKPTRINLTRPSPRLVYHCNDAISRIQEGPRPWCTQARSLSERNGEDSSDRPQRPRLSVSGLRRGVLRRFALDQSHVRIVLLVYPCVSSKSISTYGANRPTQRPRVRNVWRCHWLSKRRAKTKQITSQTSARLVVSGGGPLLWHASIPTDALQRISMTARSSRNCLQATGHAFHCFSWSEQGTRGWPNDSGRLQTGLFGVALPFKLQKKGDPARPPRDVLRD